MSRIPNPRVIFAKVPEGYPVLGETLVYQPDSETIDLENDPLNGGILTKTLYISVDPYHRALMRDPEVQGYSSPIPIGEPGASATVVKVLRSENERFNNRGSSQNWTPNRPFDPFAPHMAPDVHAPWRAYNIFPADVQATILTNPHRLPLSVFLGVGGTPGQTAFYSTYAYAKWKKGETIFVSSAAGPVGSTVVQLAKLAGLKIIGSTGSDSKLPYLHEIGVDVPFNYKKQSVWDVLKEHGPVDVYFDNVGGEQLDAALLNARMEGARFLMCGYADGYNSSSEKNYGVKNLAQIIWKRITVQTFWVSDLIPQLGPELFTNQFMPLLKDGKVKYNEHRTEGLENLDRALLGVLNGENTGKGIIVVAEE